MTDYSVLSELYHRFREVEFPRMEAQNLSQDFFYDQRLASWYEMINNNSLEQILLDAARGHGDGITTAVLRFKVPYSEIIPGSRIVLVGKGRIGRYWYSQLLLSAYCDVVAWVENEEGISKEVRYDKIIYAS
ncbi:MAG: hypothetical protein K6B69_08850, partial [Lachnospiraceae bacterium]|nr:hypothetical protein [Lachnospiraceae bacterium]